LIGTCTPNPCKNSGTCSMVNGHPHCKCKVGGGYVGDKCDKPDPCKVNPCLHKGTCEVRDASTNPTAHCKCTGGWHGDKCEHDACTQSNLCNPPHGTCTANPTTGSKISCTCHHGYSGTECKIAPTHAAPPVFSPASPATIPATECQKSKTLKCVPGPQSTTWGVKTTHLRFVHVGKTPPLAWQPANAPTGITHTIPMSSADNGDWKCEAGIAGTAGTVGKGVTQSKEKVTIKCSDKAAKPVFSPTSAPCGTRVNLKCTAAATAPGVKPTTHLRFIHTGTATPHAIPWEDVKTASPKTITHVLDPVAHGHNGEWKCEAASGMNGVTPVGVSEASSEQVKIDCKVAAQPTIKSTPPSATCNNKLTLTCTPGTASAAQGPTQYMRLVHTTSHLTNTPKGWTKVTGSPPKVEHILSSVSAADSGKWMCQSATDKVGNVYTGISTVSTPVVVPPCTDLCKGHNCNYGTCEVDAGKAKCKCFGGYKGEKCDTPIIGQLCKKDIQHKCPTKGNCIEIVKMCDGTDDCKDDNSDEGPTHCRTWRVDVVTSDMRDAHTADGGIFLNIIGKKSDGTTAVTSVERILDNRGKNDFRQGYLDTFEIKTPKEEDIKVVEQIKLTNKKGDKWHVHKVELRDPAAKTAWQAAGINNDELDKDSHPTRTYSLNPIAYDPLPVAGKYY